jgi:hypothetical protein
MSSTPNTVEAAHSGYEPASLVVSHDLRRRDHNFIERNVFEIQKIPKTVPKMTGLRWTSMEFTDGTAASEAHRR